MGTPEIIFSKLILFRKASWKLVIVELYKGFTFTRSPNHNGQVDAVMVRLVADHDSPLELWTLPCRLAGFDSPPLAAQSNPRSRQVRPRPLPVGKCEAVSWGPAPRGNRKGRGRGGDLRVHGRMDQVTPSTMSSHNQQLFLDKHIRHPLASF